MKKTIAIILAVLMLSVCSVSAFAVTDDYINTEISIYKKTTAPVIDGSVADGEYFLVDSWPNNDYLMGKGTLVDNFTVEFYACYTDDAFYYAIVTDCDDHSAYVDTTAEDDADKHFIFNAHHVMSLIIPDDPTLEVYFSGAEDGNWDWSPASALGGAFEYTIIQNSQTGENQYDNHFLKMTESAGFEYKVVSANDKDIYEIKVPFNAMKSTVQPIALTSETGTIFGFDFNVGLTDFGNGYGTKDNGASYVYLAECYNVGKALSRVAIVTLAGEFEEPVDESSATESSKPAESSKGSTTDTGDAGFIALAIIALIATAGAVVVKKVR